MFATATEPPVEVTPPKRETNRSFGPLVAAALVSMIVGVFGGWLIWGQEPESDLAFVTPGASELTDRQVEMVDMIELYVRGWQDTDGDRVASFMTEDGYLTYPERGWRFDASDGSLQDRITNGHYETLETLEPIVVYEGRVVLSGNITQFDLSWLSVIHFTTTGELKIISEHIYYWD